MTIEYNNQEKDFLTYLLYTASSSKIIQRRRTRTKIVVPILYAVFALALAYRGHYIGGLVFVAICIAWFMFYPRYEKNMYPRFYKRRLSELDRGILNTPLVMEINNANIISSGSEKESTVVTEKIASIDEIGSYIFIILKSGHTYIIPKEQVANMNSLVSFLQQLSNRLGIPYTSNLNWEWK